eukprot:gene2799-2981_t
MAGPMKYLKQFKPDKTSGSFPLLENEIALQVYATFSGLQLIIGKPENPAAWTVSFTNKRLLMIPHEIELVGWSLDRHFISEIKDCAGGLFKASKRVRLVLTNSKSAEEVYFELKFPQEDVTELKRAFLNVLKIVDLCFACDSVGDFKNLLENNKALVNLPIDSKMNTLLIMACARNKSAVAMHLLTILTDAGAESVNVIHIDTINKVTRTPVWRKGKMTEEVCGALYYACINGMEEVVEKLLSLTANVNILYTTEYTALQHAILKDIECSTSSESSKTSYTKIISMLMSHPKTIWKIADNDEELYWIPVDWILKTSYDTQKAILMCPRAKELSADLRQKLTASIQKMETKEQGFKSLNGKILRSDSIESPSKIFKSDSVRSITVNTATIDPVVEEINQCKSFFKRLGLPSTVQLAFVTLKMLQVDEAMNRAVSSKSHKTTSQLSKQRKEWKNWKEQISASIEKQITEPLNGVDFEAIKTYLLAEREKLVQYYLYEGADEHVFEGLAQFKDQVESLALSSNAKQSEDILQVTAGPTSSADITTDVEERWEELILIISYTVI